jgi:hypothetical protein
MLKTLDILIGATTVLLLFSMAVTVITQAFTSILSKRGKHLLAGLAGLLQQLGIPSRDVAESIAKAVLTHPALASVEGKLATVVHRGEFTKLLMDIAGGQPLVTLEPAALTALQKMLAANGVSDPAQTLSNIRKMALLIETKNPQIASHVREEMAILQECATDYVAKINSWFDQTIDRVSQSFAKHAHIVTVATAVIVVIVVQLDIIAVVDRLSIDDQFRSAVVNAAATDFSKATSPAPATNTTSSSTPATATPATTTPPTSTPAASTSSTSTPPTSPPASDAANPGLNTELYYNLLDTAGLITLPTNSGWLERFKDPRKLPGMILAVLLISLGAPFWYNILKDLLGLRSALAQKDDQQRAQRQGASPPSSDPGTSSPTPAPSNPLPGEQGDMAAAG